MADEPLRVSPDTDPNEPFLDLPTDSASIDNIAGEIWNQVGEKKNAETNLDYYNRCLGVFLNMGYEKTYFDVVFSAIECNNNNVFYDYWLEINQITENIADYTPLNSISDGFYKVAAGRTRLNSFNHTVTKEITMVGFLICFSTGNETTQVIYLTPNKLHIRTKNSEDEWVEEDNTITINNN